MKVSPLPIGSPRPAVVYFWPTPVRWAAVGLVLSGMPGVIRSQEVLPEAPFAVQSADLRDWTPALANELDVLTSGTLAAGGMPDPDSLALGVEADIDRESALYAEEDPTPRRVSRLDRDDEDFAEEEDVLPLEEDEILPEVAPPLPAGGGLLSFYNFNQAPVWFDPFAFNYQPYGGLLSFVPPLASRQIGPIRYGGGITAGVAATDNVFGSSNNRQGDVIFSVTPSIYLEAGTQAKVRLLYAPSYQQYTRFASESSVNQTLLLTFDVPFKRLKTGGGLGYFTRRGVFADTEGLATQDTYTGNLYASYPIARKTTGRIDYAVALTNSDPGGFVVDNLVTLSVNHQLTTRTTVGGYVGGGAVTGDDVSQTYAIAGVTATHAYSSRLQFSGSVGAQFRNLSGSSGFGDGLVTPVVNLAAVWTPTDRISLFAGVFRDMRNNAFDPSQTNIRTGGNLGAAIVLAPRLTLGLNGAIAYMEEISDRNTSDAEYFYGFGEVSLNYELNSWSTARAFYSHTLRAAIRGADGFGQNTVGVAVSVRF